MNGKLAYRLLAAMTLVIVLFAIGLGVHAFLPPVAHSKLAPLTKDTTRYEVELILGKPASVIPAVFGDEAWRYETKLRFGWVDVFFENGKVIEYNYERF
jgi:hypothetical protein